MVSHYHRAAPNLCRRPDMAKATPRGSMSAFLEAHLNENLAARFWAKVDKSGPVPAHCPELGPCWIWTAGASSDGYGRIRITSHGDSRCCAAHRVALALSGTNPPDDLQVRHRCDNPPCCNPAHLLLGTQFDNMHDMMERGRHWAQKRTTCRNGHDLTLPNAVRRRRYQNVCVRCWRVWHGWSDEIKPPQQQKKVSPEHRQEMRLRREAGEAFARIAADYGVSTATVFRICKAGPPGTAC